MLDTLTDELYREMIIDHNRNPRNFGELENPDCSAEGHNPLCGDKVDVTIKFDAEGKVNKINFTGSGCAISQASASMMTEFVKGKSKKEIREIFSDFQKLITSENENVNEKLGKLTVFEGLRQFPSRTKCATLAWHTVSDAIFSK